MAELQKKFLDLLAEREQLYRDLREDQRVIEEKDKLIKEMEVKIARLEEDRGRLEAELDHFRK